MGGEAVSDLHERIVAALGCGWTVEDAKSFSLPALREVVRPVSPALAREISEIIAKGWSVVAQVENGEDDPWWSPS